MRLFVAIDLDESLKPEITKLQNCLKGYSGIKLVEPENLHLTLKFLGEVQEFKLNDIKKILSLIEFEKFVINLKGLGFFPSEKRPRVVWIGVTRGEEKVRKLAELINNELARLGFKKEKDFKSHITIARIKRFSGEIKLKVLDLLKTFGDKDFGEMMVENFKLKRSILKTTGPVYYDLALFNLK